jgi:hypothetical protein
MTKNQHQVTSKNSRPSAAPQLKTAHSRAGARPASTSPSIALFLKGDAGTSEDVIDLSKAEYAALKRAAAPSGDGILMFMANAALEKIGWPGSSSPFRGGLIVILQRPDGTEWTRVYFNALERHSIEACLKATGLTLLALIEKAVSSQAAQPSDRREAA